MRLIYFDLPVWRAEIIRIPLFIGDIPFEDKRVTSKEWDFCKKNGSLPDGTIIPFQQLPVLEINGQIIAQSSAIARFCGKMSEFYPGNNDLFAAKIDQIIDASNDINLLLRPSSREKSEAKKIELRKKLSNEELPMSFNMLENLLIRNKTKWMAGDEFSIADIAVWRLIGWLKSGIVDYLDPNIINNYPLLNNLCFEVANLPKIKEWVRISYPNHYKKYLEDDKIKWQ